MKGYYEGYSYVGYMPDGRKMRFATDSEYIEAYAEEARASLFRILNNGYYRKEGDSIWLMRSRMSCRLMLNLRTMVMVILHLKLPGTRIDSALATA